MKLAGRTVPKMCGGFAGLLVAAAIVLSPTPASAQKKKNAKPAAAAPAAPAASAAAGASAGAAGAGAGAGGEIDIDDPNATAPTPRADANAAPAGDAAPATGGGGICEIDPSACPKEIDVKAASNKDVKAEVYAVQQIYALRNHRIEIQPYWGFTMNDQFVSHSAPGLALNYYITNVLAVGINGNLYAPFNVDSDFNFQNRRATRVAVPLTQYQWGGNLNFTYVPIYGKFAGFGNFIFHYDAYVVGGVGAISTRPIPVIDPDNRKFDYKMKVAFNAGIGLRIFLNRWFAVIGEIRDYIYNEELENLSIATTQEAQRDSSTWYGENRLTNNVQAQVGVSIFLPPSWEYRLPK